MGAITTIDTCEWQDIMSSSDSVYQITACGRIGNNSNDGTKIKRRKHLSDSKEETKKGTLEIKTMGELYVDKLNLAVAQRRRVIFSKRKR